MRISTVVCFDLETGRELYRESFEYNGPVSRACGASGAMKSAFNEEQNVAQQMQNEFGTVFGENQGILNSLSSALTPIVSAGPNQQGFSPAEEAAMRTQAMDTTSAAGQQASNAVRQELASEGGGNTYLPSGSDAAINAGIAENTAQQNASEQLGITQADYNQGRQNFFNAEGALAGAPGALENPVTGAGEAAEGAAQGAFEGANSINQANNAWEGELGGLVGSLGSAAINAWCVAVGTMILTVSEAGFRIVKSAEGLTLEDSVVGVDGVAQSLVALPEITEQECVQVTTENGLTLVCSAAHTLECPLGGYVRAHESRGERVRTKEGVSRIAAVTSAGKQQVVRLRLNGSHTYLSDGIWSEE